MRITVLITTRGRPASFRCTLESLLSPSNVATPDWETIVVTDAECNDGTADVCQEFARKFPRHFRFFVQPISGKSNALNLGIAAATGDVIALTDDDVLVASDYVESVRKVFTNYTVEAVQGRIVLDCEGGLPPWVGERQARFMGLSDYGDEVLEWTHHTLFGTSMAVRAESARRVGGFSAELGAGTPAGFAEDTEFSLRLRRAGCKFLYAPQIVVRHQLPRERLTPAFFRKRYFRVGRSRAYYEPLPWQPIWHYGLYALKSAALNEAEAVWHRIRNRPAEALDCQCYAREYVGFFAQHCRFFFGEPSELTRMNTWPDRAAHNSSPLHACDDSCGARPIDGPTGAKPEVASAKIKVDSAQLPSRV